MKPIVKAILALCALCSCVLCGCASTHGNSAAKVGIYMSGSNQTSPESEFTGIKLTDALSESSKFTVTERTREFLSMIEKENAYQQSGAVDNSQIAEIGQKSGVTYVCVAELIDLSDFFPESKETLVTARFISVDSATVVASTYRIAALPNKPAIVAVSKLLVNDLLSAMKKRDQWVNLGEKGVKKENTAVYLVDGEVGMGKILQIFLINAVLKRDKYAISERTSSSLEALMSELKHQYSGAVADNQLAKLGKQSGVKYVIALRQIDNETRDGDGSRTDSQWVNIRMIDVTTGDIVKGKSKTEAVLFTNVKTLERSMASLIAAFLGNDTFHEPPPEPKAAPEKSTEERKDAGTKPNAAKQGKQPAALAQPANTAKEKNTPKPERVGSDNSQTAAKKTGRDVSEIKRVIERNTVAILSAYNTYKQQRRGAYSATAKKISVKISIDESGKVTAARIMESTLADADIEATVLSYVKRWAFEKIDKPGDVEEITFPIVFPADPPRLEENFGGGANMYDYDDYDDYDD